MEEFQELQLVHNKLQCTSSTAKLLSALGYTPLTITQAAVYVQLRVRMTMKTV
jgi:hypothetical protein